MVVAKGSFRGSDVCRRATEADAEQARAASASDWRVVCQAQRREGVVILAPIRYWRFRICLRCLLKEGDDSCISI